MKPLLLDETFVLELFGYVLAAAAVLALVLGAGLWWALRGTLKRQSPATSRPGCVAALVAAAVLGLLLLRMLA